MKLWKDTCYVSDPDFELLRENILRRIKAEQEKNHHNTIHRKIFSAEEFLKNIYTLP